MHIIYWAHSYRKEDAPLNNHFGILIEQSERMIVNFDPPSPSVNESKLAQNLRSCDGMVAVLSWRDRGTSPYLIYEVGLSLRARKPLAVFIDDRLPTNILPSRILQRRFSHRTYFRQFREHTDALRLLRSSMGDPPPSRYQPNASQRTCGLVGLRPLDRNSKNFIHNFVALRGFQPIDLEKLDATNDLAFEKYEHLATLDVALEFVDSRTVRSAYWAGALSAAAVPRIAITINPNYPFSDLVPRDFQPRQANVSGGASLEEVLSAEFDLYEQNFLAVEDAEAIERYTKMQVAAAELAGRYESDTRKQFTEVIMGNKINLSNSTVGVIGDHAQNVTVTQAWNNLSPNINLVELADQLRRLGEALGNEATQPSQKLAVGAIAAAEQSARDKDGPKVLEYLKTAGKWAFDVAEKIGVEVAKDAIKVALAL
jgi:hypothetical protein